MSEPNGNGNGKSVKLPTWLVQLILAVLVGISGYYMRGIDARGAETQTKAVTTETRVENLEKRLERIESKIDLLIENRK